MSENCMVIHTPASHAEGGKLTYSARIEMPSETYEMWFRGEQHVMEPHGADAFVVACLPTAMRLGLDMEVKSNVSSHLLAGIDRIQDILCKWHADFSRISIRAEARQATMTQNNARGTLAFFSGGVDSFYTALKHQHAISALLLVHGFDLELENTSLRERVSASMRTAADALGKPLIEIETNSKPFTNRYVFWDLHQFGPALASVAVLLGGLGHRVLVPSSESYARLDPCASHPLLDSLWSTEYLELVHDGAEASRNEKVAMISGFPPVLSLLRVCWENPGNAYNCGKCEKCIRTMLNLEAAGALEKCTAFDAGLEPQRVAELKIPSQLVAYLFEENLHALKVRGANPALILALEKALARFESQKVARALEALPELSADTPGLPTAVARHWRSLLKAMGIHQYRRWTNLARYYRKRIVG